MYYKKDFAHLLSEMKKFWSVDDQNSAFKQMAFAFKVLLWVFMGGCIVAVFFYLSKPFFPSHTLPTELWIPNVYFFTFNFIYVYQLSVIIYILISLVAFDILFEAFTFGVLLQFKLLNEKFSQINFGDTNFEKNFDFLKFSQCVEHHVFLTK